MNRITTYLISFLLLLGVAACKRDKACTLMDYIFVLPEPIFEEADYLKVYPNEEAFATGQQAEDVDSLLGSQLVLSADIEVMPFLDIRFPDGTNSWSNQAEITRLAQIQASTANCATTLQYPDITSLKNVINSSATYMHLALDDEHQDGGERNWKIDRIYDEDETDVSNQPEWQCIKGLVFTFFKGGKGAKVKIGSLTGGTSCGAFQELFGDRTEAFATYSLEGAEQKELRITVPAVSDALKKQLTFTVIESTYSHLRISLTNGNSQIGYAVLTPFES